MKKILITILSIFVLFFSPLSCVKAEESNDNCGSNEIGTSSPNFEEINEMKSVGCSYKYVFESRKYQYSSNWGYHPSFSSWQYCDGYVLSTSSSVNMSISISVSVLSISVAGASSSGSIIVNADNSKASRPYVYGTVCYDIYRVEVYDSLGNLVSTSQQWRFVKNNSTLGYAVKYR